MTAELQDAGIAFDADEDMPGLWLNMNDVFAYACADTEQVEDADIQTVYAIWKEQGSDGVIDWVAQKRGEQPIHKEQQ